MLLGGQLPTFRVAPYFSASTAPELLNIEK
jgi:hypothetical protein